MSMHPVEEPNNRRAFLKLGVFSTGLLASASLVSGLTGCAAKPLSETAESLKLLRPKDVVILTALAPIVLGNAIPTEPEARAIAIDKAVRNTDDFLFRSSEFNHGALAELFDLLSLAPTRIALAGVWSPWETASDSAKKQFLVNWRDSSFGLFRTGYTQITQLLSISWYKDPQSWTPDMYPGPPVHRA
ncbi:hypothetical protein A9Q99_22340 [Gammaproteobacteria bacterium 45_16_T64]|nr:hypothetical protein A9Q99_22340 [Gammaproteobacteria bacterium 45_16_T64]